ncbi:MAG: hypothetical protein RLO05_02225, partial [Rhodospirillales bacterium]
LTVNDLGGGQLLVTITLDTPLGAGRHELVRVDAQVPFSAVEHTAHRLAVSQVFVVGGDGGGVAAGNRYS